MTQPDRGIATAAAGPGKGAAGLTVTVGIVGAAVAEDAIDAGLTRRPDRGGPVLAGAVAVRDGGLGMGGNSGS